MMGRWKVAPYDAQYQQSEWLMVTLLAAPDLIARAQYTGHGT
jgi:hypothetical protein